MADALKDMFNKKFYEHLALEFNKIDKNLHPDKFVKDVMLDIDSMSLHPSFAKSWPVVHAILLRDF